MRVSTEATVSSIDDFEDFGQTYEERAARAQEEYSKLVDEKALAQRSQRQFLTGLAFDTVIYGLMFGSVSWIAYTMLKKQDLSPAWKKNLLPISLGTGALTVAGSVLVRTIRGR